MPASKNKSANRKKTAVKRRAPIPAVIPGHKNEMPMVGIGGSAGSIPALEDIFKKLPPDAGIVYVVILHLLPERESMLAEVLQTTTRMPVVQATDGVRVKLDHVYVIPPGKYLVSMDGHLQLTDAKPQRGKRMAVDHFFRTLAETHGLQATAIVLSGADGDGALGIKRIKECGGLTIAQDPEEAMHPEMPRSAIGTGMVDWVLRLDDIPKKLLAYYTQKDQLQLPPEVARPTPSAAEQALKDVLTLLRTKTGRDFTYYKRATVLRRISRRMLVVGIPDLRRYVRYMRTHQGESAALLDDMLVSVTNFFRDTPAFHALETQIAGLFHNKDPGDSVRVWVPGCATGEEAYSIAILLFEYARKMDFPPKIQIFATDLDQQVIASAREGLYPHTISVDVPEERLRTWFTKELQGYRILRDVRDAILFAQHDMLQDSPFSRLDLISCRNLLIYLNRDAQTRAFGIFHYALNENGKLFLGASEMIEDGHHFFSVVDKKHRIYQRRQAVRVMPPIPEVPSLLARAVEAETLWRHKSAIPGVPAKTPPEPGITGKRGTSWADLHYKLLERFVAPSILVDKKYDILHLSENAAEFLSFSGGEPTRNILRAIRSELRIALRSALYKTAKTGRPTEIVHVPVNIKDAQGFVDIRVSSAKDVAPDFMLVVFTTESGDRTASKKAFRIPPDSVARQLEQELDNSKNQLRIVIEQHEVSMEEVKAGNEELQAMNEELRSATEELETSREELQSINEELTTVNHELQRKVEELAHSNSDLHNLIGSTAIATLFLDRNLSITRFTPTAVSLFNLIDSDIGRPLSDLTNRLNYPEMNSDAGKVLRQLAPIEREVMMQGGHWFLAKLVPYRTIEDKIAGVVMTFLDIHQQKENEQELRKIYEALAASEERLRLMIENATDYAIFSTDTNRRITLWNSGAQRLLGYSEAEIIGKPADEIFTQEDRKAGVPAAEAKKALAGKQAITERWYVRKDGSRFWGSGATMMMRDSGGKTIGLVKIFRDQTDELESKKALEKGSEELREALKENERILVQLESAAKAKDHFLAVLSHELRTPLTPVLISLQTLAFDDNRSAEDLESFEMIERNIKLEARLIDDLLDLTRITRGKLEILREPVDMHTVVKDALHVVTPDIRAKFQNLQVSLNATEFRLSGDAMRLQQIVWNLLKNASKFTPEKGKIIVHSKNRDGRIVIEISDNGVGIDPKAIAHIFDAFTQESTEIARKFGGLGLGLAIARAVTSAHDGGAHRRKRRSKQGKYLYTRTASHVANDRHLKTPHAIRGPNPIL